MKNQNYYTLLFNGVAGIGRRNGGQTKGVLWEIMPECERNLDGYEGFPRLYTKRNYRTEYLRTRLRPQWKLHAAK